MWGNLFFVMRGWMWMRPQDGRYTQQKSLSKLRGFLLGYQDSNLE